MNKKVLFAAALAIGSLVGIKSAVAQEMEELIPVYRWYSSVDKNYVTVADDEYQEGQLLNWKYKDKTLMFYAYRNPGPDRVAVYKWYNLTTKDFVTVAEDEYTDDQMLKMGYTNKKLQFFAPTVRASNRVAIYRWYLPKAKDWITVPEEGDTEVLGNKKGYKYKTFQFYGVKRDIDEMMYFQPLNR